MKHLDVEKTERYRRQLLAAVVARYFWITLSTVLILWFDIPFARLISMAGGVLAVLNTFALVSFWKLKFDRPMIYLMISSDSLVLLYALAATGLFTSPFTMVLIVVAAFTVLVTDLKYGIFTAAFSSIGYCALGILSLRGLLPAELHIPPYDQVQAILHMVVLTTALFSITGILGFVVSRLQKSEVNYFEQGRALAERNHEMSTDLAIAATVQQAIQAQSTYDDERVAISGKVKPMLEVGGDYFEIIRCGGDRLCIFVADVSGHGAGSALITAMLKVSLENAAAGETDAARILGKINNDMCRIIGSTDFYLTGVLCVIDTDSLLLEYCGAAHPEMYLLSGEQVIPLESGGTILGKLPSLNFPKSQRQLAKNDRLLIYSDGITEARNLSGEFWGEERLQEILQTGKMLSAGAMTAKVLAALEDFDGTGKANDDRTLVTVDIIATPRMSNQPVGDSDSLVANVDAGRTAIAAGNTARVIELLQNKSILPLRVKLSLTRYLRKNGQAGEALQFLLGLQQQGQNSSIEEELGRTYLALGNKEEARRQFERLNTLENDGMGAYYLAKISSL
jgi:serine phosphatase RsbU (regulator of sigma subunit)